MSNISDHANNDEMESFKWRLKIIAILGIIGICIWVFMSSMEANSYNAITGKQVTTWQAIWVQLRVQEPAK